MKSFATLLATLSIVVAVFTGLSGVGVRLEWWGFPIGFQLLKVAFVSALVVGLLSLTLLIVGLLKGIPLKSKALLAVVVSGSVAAIPYFSVKEFRKIPTYGDAATDFQNLPAFDVLAEARKSKAKPPPLFSLSEAELAQKKYFPDLAPIKLDYSPAQAQEDVIKVLSDMKLRLAPNNDDSYRVEATETSFWFGFKDDVVVVIKGLPSGGSQVDVRSASRVGKFDGGANAKRVEAILAALQKAR